MSSVQNCLTAKTGNFLQDMRFSGVTGVIGVQTSIHAGLPCYTTKKTGCNRCNRSDVMLLPGLQGLHRLQPAFMRPERVTPTEKAGVTFPEVKRLFSNGQLHRLHHNKKQV